MRFAVLVCLLATALAAPTSMKPFKQGQNYVYQFRTQVSSSLLAYEPSMIPQMAATGLQAQLRLTFTNDNHARVQLRKIRLGEMNGKSHQGQQEMLDIKMFEKRKMPEEMQRKLELPFSVNLVDGVVQRINFNDNEESSFSKNLKRAALNMLQLNLKRNDVQGLKMQSSQPKDEKEDRRSNVFTVPEITLEGECETVYTIQHRNSKHQEDEENSQERENKQQVEFNVTKSVNFDKCLRTSDVTYGFQPNPAQQLLCHKCLKQTEIKSMLIGKTEQQEMLKITQCREECQTNQLTNNNNIERSTVAQFELYGNTQKYAIRRSRIISQYVVKIHNPESQNTISQVVAISELLRQEQEDDSEVEQTTNLGKDHTLLYSPEWDLNEKRFFMWGDEEFDSKRVSPFGNVRNKAQQAEKHMLEILKQWAEDKEMGYELTSAALFNKLVQLIRQSSVSELKKIEENVVGVAQQVRDNSEKAAEHAKSIFYDALGSAATRNSLYVLSQKIKQQEIGTLKAAQVIKVLMANTHSPSDRQAEILEQIANSDAAQRCPILQQTAWLAYGTMIGQICQQRPGQSQKYAFRVEELCPEAKKEQFKKTLILQWKQANSVYEQILALKVIGNSALDKTMPELRNIITDRLQPTLIRMEAIDALRRLRTNQPERIQQLLMPIFMDQREKPEIRMAAVSMVMYTHPSTPVIDQIAFSVQNDRSQNVRSFVLTAMDSYSRSPVSAERHIAQHLKAVLKLTKITPDQMRASRKYRVPIYVSVEESTEEQNIFLGLTSIVSPSNLIPIHLAASIRAAFNGDVTQEKLQLSFTQKDMEQLYEKFSNVYHRYQNDDDNEKSEERQSAKDLRQIYSSIGIKSRRTGVHYMSSEESEESSESAKRSTKAGNNSPFAMLALRVNDVDRVILPLDEKMMPQMIRQFLDGEKVSLNSALPEDVRSQLSSGRHFHKHIALSVSESKVKLPTSAGLPLAITFQTSAVASIEGKIQAEVELRQQKLNGELKLRTSAIATNTHKIEVWTPAVVSGVKSLRTVELNHGEFKIRLSVSRDQVKISIMPPHKEQKDRILGLHTLPATYTQKFQWETRTYEESQLRTIRNYALEPQQVEYHSNDQHNRAIRVEGNIHKVQTVEDLIAALYTTENNIHIFFKPGQHTPEEISVRVSGSAFQLDEKNEHKAPEFDDFYSPKGNSQRKPFRSIYEDNSQSNEQKSNDRNNDEQDSDSNEDEYKNFQFSNNKQRESRLSGYSQKYRSNKAYKHGLIVELEARTPVKSHTASMQLDGNCDQSLQHCKATVNLKRSAIGDERDQWELESKIQTVLPENVRGEEDPEQKQSRMLIKAEANWGPSGQQSNNLHIRLQGEPTRKTFWQRSESNQKWSTFLNKFDLIADYKLQSQKRHVIQRLYELIKAKYYWQLDSQRRKNDENTIRASLMIDPVSRRYANFTVETPEERIRARMIELPMRIQGYSLERRPQNYHSFGHLVQSYSQGSGECRVDDRRIKTFDGVSYRVPSSHGCWSVLAKDCRENPRFVVLMKKSDDENKIKIITTRNTIELERKSEKKDIVVKVDGKRVEEDQLSQYGIEKSNFEVYVNQRHINVRFDGNEARIKIDGMYKNIQCGLCGHYNQEESDIFRTSDNKRTDSLKTFHRSYALKNQECNEQKINKYYQDRGSEEFQVRPRKQQSAYYRDSSEQQDENDDSDEDTEWWSSSEENSKDNQKNKPVERTQVLEYAQKVCFSVKPVKKCPHGTIPDENTEPKTNKVPFFCLNRSSSQARRLQRQVRQGKVVESVGSPSFVDNVEEPTKCQQAEYY